MKIFPNFVEITKPISDFLKRDQKLVWDKLSKQAFNDIKQGTSSAPMLVSKARAFLYKMHFYIL
jgi:hypothetical protein